MELIVEETIRLIIEIAIFLVLMVIFKYFYSKLKNNHSRILNPSEYFPEEELQSLKQIFYLIMMGFFFVIILYTLVFVNGDLYTFSIIDIIISLYLAVNLDKSSLKNKLLLILIIPYGSLTFLLFGDTLIGILDLIHIPVYIYFIKLYYDKFKEYTESNSLGITILLLFTIIFISFFITQFTEGVNPLDSLVMVSNAFTSNGYAILGNSTVGKINSIILVWGGYLLSGVGTATLASAILIRHFNSRFEKLEKMIEENNKKD